MLEENEKRWCVYIHTNLTNNKVYVGLTSNLSRRWQGNGSEYLSKSSPFASAIKKYGWGGFSHEIVQDGLTLEEANALERKLILVHKSNINRFGKKYGYNQTDGGDGASGVRRYGKDNSFWGKHHTEETKEKISKSKLGKHVGEKSPLYGTKLPSDRKIQISNTLKEWYSKNRSKSCKAVVCITDDYKKFDSVKEAADFYNLNARSVSSVCTGNLKTIHGMKFTYSMDGAPPKYKYVYKDPKERSEKLKKFKSLPVECVETGIIYESGKVASQAMGMKSRSSICQCCKGKLKTAAGYHWRYVEVS